MSRLTEQLIFALCLALTCVSCRQDDDAPDNAGALTGDVSLRAYVLQTPASRVGGDGIVPVTLSDYTLSYKQNADLQTLRCHFDESGNGIAYHANGTPLQWKDFSKNGVVTFFLDNIEERTNVEPAEFDDKGVLTYFGPDWSDATVLDKYKAAVEDGTNTNDIVWGTVSPNLQDNPVNMQLTHRMARVNVVLRELSPELAELAEKGGVTVSLSNIIVTPQRFNRLTGEVMLPETVTDADYTEVELLGSGELERVDDSGFIVYMTPNLILPPQKIQETHRVRLKISFSDGSSYSGIVPLGMFYVDGNYAAELAFLAGRHLEIRVKLSDNKIDPEIEFMPVLVREWVDKGEHIVSGSPVTEVGIKSMDDLEYLIHCYNSQTEIYQFSDIVYALFGYGSMDIVWKKGGPPYSICWTFKLLADLEGEVKELLKRDYKDSYYDIVFDFNGHTINGSNSLDDLLDGVAPGIKSAEDLERCIEIYNSFPAFPLDGNGAVLAEVTEVQELLLNYGYNMIDWEIGKLVVTLEFKADIADMPATVFNSSYHADYYPITFNFNGHTVGGLSGDEAVKKLLGY